MPRIVANADYATFINTFEVDPADQPEVLDALQDTMHIAEQHPGFISASAHPSLDGRHIFMYLQWRSAEDLHHLQASPQFRAIAPRFAGKARFASHQCRVAHVVDRAGT
jgi:heme-degrading monooxygenase HmoA